MKLPSCAEIVAIGIVLIQASLLLQPATQSGANAAALHHQKTRNAMQALEPDSWEELKEFYVKRRISQHEHNRKKRRPLPILSTWLQQRRSGAAAESSGFNPQLSASRHQQDHGADETEPDANEFEDNDTGRIQEMMNAIRKLQAWETALLRRFGDRFKDKAEKLAMNPMWIKVMKLRAMLHRLKAMVETQQPTHRKLDTTRMKK